MFIIKKIIFWLPRISALFFAFFLAIFALDVFYENYSFVKMILAFVIHLIPALIVLAFVLISWKMPGYGAMFFLGLAIFYLFYFSDLSIGTKVIISGPLFLISFLFFLDKIFNKLKYNI